ncbi:hypothetical protein HanRHA438_Chr17g0828241 [Helianthus annuus]|nr:hypothetical protein HanRHA438_Chr17g0828241 [Helianthus annuus]
MTHLSLTLDVNAFSWQLLTPLLLSFFQTYGTITWKITQVPLVKCIGKSCGLTQMLIYFTVMIS